MTVLPDLTPIAYGVTGGLLVLTLKTFIQWSFENWSRWTGDWYDCIYDDDGNLLKRDVLRLRNFPSTSSVSGSIRGEFPYEKRAHRKWKLKGRIIGNDFIAHFWSAQKGVHSYGAWLLHQHGDADYMFRGKYLKWDDKNNLPPNSVKLMVVRCDKWKEEYNKWVGDGR